MLCYNRILHLKPEFSLSTDFWYRPQSAVLHKYRSFLAMCANYITAKKPPLVNVWADHRYLFHRRQVFIQPTRHAIARDGVKPPFLRRRGLRDGNFSQPFFQPALTDHHRNWVSPCDRNLNNNRPFQSHFFRAISHYVNQKYREEAMASTTMLHNV